MSAAVTVAVVSYNTRELLAACLESLRADHDSGLAEVVVVDNASSDGSPAMVAERFPWVSLHAERRNLGFGAAVNLAVRGSGAEWVAPANADIRVEPGALGDLIGAARGRPLIGAAAPRLLMPGGQTQHSVHPFPGPGPALAANLGLQRLLPGLGDRLCLAGAWDPEREREVGWAHGAFLLVRRSAFERIGGFDAGQWMYAEDIDLAWRLRQAGMGTLYVPDACVHHEVGAATREAFAEEREVRHLAASYRWLRRRRGPARARAMAAVCTSVPATKAALLAGPALIAPSWGRPRLDRARRRRRVHARAIRHGFAAEQPPG